MIRLLRTSDHAWYVSRICDVHNHKLSEGYVEKKQWNSHNSIDHSMKHYIKKLRENNVSIGRVCSILNSSNSNTSQNIRKETIRASLEVECAGTQLKQYLRGCNPCCLQA